MRFGTGKDIIPPVAPMNVACSGVFDKHFQWVHDDVYVRCLVLDDGKEKAVLMAFDLLFHDRNKNKTYAVQRERRGVKKAKLAYRVLAEKDGRTLVQVRLFTGRTHQIRAQFSSRRCPLLGDRRYGGDAADGLGLWAFRLTLPGGCYTALPEPTGVWAGFAETLKTMDNGQ